uniref:Transposase n=1 Tax=Globodera rostochiensis TaxID=31243 RepID=A0A914H780_GLORO
MEEFWILILVAFFATKSLDKAESVKLELKTFDEIFGEGWWDKGEAEDLKTPAPTNFGQNVHHQIDRMNTQFGQIEPNSTDQNTTLTESDHSGQIEPNSTDQNPLLTESDHSGQIEPNSTDQNPLLTESDHSDNAKAEDEQKRKIIDKFHAIKEELKQKGKFPWKERIRIEKEIAKQLGVNYSKIYKWKKEFGLSRKMHNFGKEKEERKNLVEKFDQRKAELTRAGFKNSYKQEIDKTVAKELGLSFATFYNWKRKLGQTASNKYPHSEQKELLKRYYQIKDQSPKISDEVIAKMLKIGSKTLYKWKKKFERQQLDENSVDGHSVEVNAAANVQEIGNSNSESI